MNGTFAVCLFFVSGDAVAPLRGGTLWWSWGTPLHGSQIPACI